MAIPESFIAELNERADIVELVGRYVPLKKAGANYQGLCPFHNEKSPSFSVSPSKNFYHCFGCGAHGGPIRFLMEHQGMGFVDAVKDLAGQLGLSVPEDGRSPQERARDAQLQERKRSLSEYTLQAAQAYIGFLKQDKAAQNYLKGRGLTGQMAARFKLGWAPAGKPLAGVFADYTDSALEEVGLVIQNEQGRRYDRFRERIMFPIRNLKGEVIGFGGRIVGAGEPKYLNSPETPLFHKGRELYGLFEGRADIQQAGFALVTEGYMDVVALAQHGMGNAVASLGTACTPEQVQKLFRFTPEIVFAFDGDKAGQKAAQRVLPGVLPHANDTRLAKFLFLPPEHDPDSYVREYGRDAFLRLVHHAMPLSRFLLESAREPCDMSSTEGRSRFVSLLQPHWQLLPQGVLKQQLLHQIAELAQLGSHELLQLWGLARPEDAAAQGQKPPRPDSRWAERRPAEGRWLGRPQGSGFSPSHVVGSRPRNAPHSRHDRAAQLLLTHMAAWDALSAAQHNSLCHLPEPHGSVMRWIEAQLQEEGPQPWAVLQTQLPSAWAQQAQQWVARLPNAQERLQQLASAAPRLLQSDVQELQGIVLDIDLAQAEAESQALAQAASQQPSPENLAAYQSVMQRIRQLKLEKTLLEQQRRGH